MFIILQTYFFIKIFIIIINIYFFLLSFYFNIYIYIYIYLLGILVSLKLIVQNMLVKKKKNQVIKLSVQDVSLKLYSLPFFFQSRYYERVKNKKNGWEFQSEERVEFQSEERNEIRGHNNYKIDQCILIA